ncbi:MAG: radical SAM protein [archaeon]
MKIILANPPWTVGKMKGRRAGTRWPHLKLSIEPDSLPYPLFLAYASSLLKKNEFDVKSVDAIGQNIGYAEFHKIINEFSPDLIFLETSAASFDRDLGLLKEIKKNNDVKIAITGPDLTISDESLLINLEPIDFILVGGYEQTLLVLCEHIRSKKKIEKIRGLICRTKKAPNNNHGARRLTNIDKLPWPDRKSFPVFRYHEWQGGLPSPSATMIASRGCLYHSSLCYWPQLAVDKNDYRTRDIKDVVDEMEMLKSKGFRSIYFDDDSFNNGKKRMLELAAELKRRNWKLPWAFRERPDFVDEEILTKFKEVGLIAVKYGVESLARNIVHSSGTIPDPELATKNMLLTKRLGIKMHLTFTFGLPGETKETLQKSIDYALSINPDSVQFSVLTQFHSTKFNDKLKPGKNLTSESSGNNSIIDQRDLKPNLLSYKYLLNAQRAAYEKWQWFKEQEQKHCNMSPTELFADCLKENGLGYTLKHTLAYIKNKRLNSPPKSLIQDKGCDILLINTPPWGPESPPLTFAYLESFLEKLQYRTDFMDLNIEIFNTFPKYQYLWNVNNKKYWDSKESVKKMLRVFDNLINKYVDKIAKHPAGLIGFSFTLGKQLVTKEIIKRIRKRCDKRIVVGGRYFFECPPTEKDAELIDLIIMGESESVIPEIIDKSRKRRPLINIPGTVFFKDNKWVSIPQIKKQANLKEYPYPKFNNFNLDLYITRGLMHTEWGRGCVGKCVICVYSIPGLHYSMREPENIFDEIKYNAEVNNINHVSLVDAAINCNMKKLGQVCDLLIENNMNVTWSGLAIPWKEMTPTFLAKMKKAGCNRLEYGLESGSEKIVKMMKKIPTVLEVEKVLKDTKEAGIQVVVYIVVGFPGETQQDFQMTLDMLRRLKDVIGLVRGVQAFLLIIGTEVNKNYREYGIIYPETGNKYTMWKTYDGNTPEIRISRIKEVYTLLDELGISHEGSMNTLNEYKEMLFKHE